MRDLRREKEKIIAQTKLECTDPSPAKCKVLIDKALDVKTDGKSILDKIHDEEDAYEASTKEDPLKGTLDDIKRLNKEIQDINIKRIAKDTFSVGKYLTLKKGGEIEGKAIQEKYAVAGEGIVGFISHAIDMLVVLVGTIGMVALAIGGFVLVTSQGNETRTEHGKTILFYTFFGLLFVFLSYTIISLIQGIFYSL